MKEEENLINDLAIEDINPDYKKEAIDDTDEENTVHESSDDKEETEKSKDDLILKMNLKVSDDKNIEKINKQIEEIKVIFEKTNNQIISINNIFSDFKKDYMNFEKIIQGFDINNNHKNLSKDLNTSIETLTSKINYFNGSVMEVNQAVYNGLKEKFTLIGSLYEKMLVNAIENADIIEKEYANLFLNSEPKFDNFLKNSFEKFVIKLEKDYGEKIENSQKIIKNNQVEIFKEIRTNKRLIVLIIISLFSLYASILYLFSDYNF